MEQVKDSDTPDSHTQHTDTIGQTADVEAPSHPDNVTHATDASATMHAAGTTTAGIRDTPGDDAAARKDEGNVKTTTPATDSMHDAAPVSSLEATPSSSKQRLLGYDGVRVFAPDIRTQYQIRQMSHSKTYKLHWILRLLSMTRLSLPT